MSRSRKTTLASLLVLLAACSRFGAVYPERPAPSAGGAFADPPPARVVVHVTVTGDAMKTALDSSLPAEGEGSFSLLGSDRAYKWTRDPVVIRFDQGRISIDTQVHAKIFLPLHATELPLSLHVLAEPVISSRYAMKLQSVDVKVTSSDSRLAVANKVAGLYDVIGGQIAEKVRAFSYDLTPLVSGAAARLARPMPLEVGSANACAVLKVLGIEAGPTVLADGLEKDLSLLVAPSVVLPCPDDSVPATPDIPPLANVATLQPGPFTVTIPIAARYEELTHAMSAAFTDGKLFFSEEYPKLYMEKPELYESDGRIVLKMHIAGPISKLGIDADLNGDLFLAGHPTVVDNELSFPDLEPTIETKNFLLSIKAITGSDSIRDQARKALRLDIGDRLEPVKKKLSTELHFEVSGGCFDAEVDRVQVTGVFAHAAYLRMYVDVTARARATMPCAVPAETPTTPGDAPSATPAGS